MSETKHTPGLLVSHIKNGRKLMAGDRDVAIAASVPGNPPEAWANARRIAACWNALQNLTTEEIEKIDPVEVAGVMTDFKVFKVPANT